MEHGILRLAAAPVPVRNAMLAALQRTEYRRLLARMQHVQLAHGEILYQADRKIEHVYFPEDAVVAMVNTTEDARTVEVGVIGREGMVGINIFLGGITTPDKAVVQIPGGALRMKARDLRSEMRFGSALHRLLLAYTQVFLAVISQSIACSEYHRVDQRLARWLLLMHRYAPGSFAMSHQNMAAMLGARRTGITIAAAALRDEKLIGYRRGRVSVLNEAGLQARACECYRFMTRQYDGLLKRTPRILRPPA